jgi:hypothetical protein
MKKLLVLLLVLGMASAASAALVVSQPDPTSLEVVVSGDLTQDLYLILSSDGVLSGFTIGADAPDLSNYAGPTSDLAGMGLFPVGYVGEYWVMASSQNPYPLTGTYLTAMGGDVGDSVNLSWFDEAGGAGDLGTIILVPEPMTVALLGLGGLLMLRRRK